MYQKKHTQPPIRRCKKYLVEPFFCNVRQFPKRDEKAKFPLYDKLSRSPLDQKQTRCLVFQIPRIFYKYFHTDGDTVPVLPPNLELPISLRKVSQMQFLRRIMETEPPPGKLSLISVSRDGPGIFL